MPEVTVFVGGRTIPKLWFDALMAQLAFTKIGFAAEDVYTSVVKGPHEEDVLVVVLTRGRGSKPAFVIVCGEVSPGWSEASLAADWGNWARFWNDLSQSERDLCWSQSTMKVKILEFMSNMAMAQATNPELFPERREQ